MLLLFTNVSISLLLFNKFDLLKVNKILMGRAFEFRKERKHKRWAKMSKQFTRIGREIVMAVKEGGPDEEYNPKLRMVIQNAKAINMPKDNIKRAIKRAMDKNNKENYEEVVFEGYAPHGIAIIVETATDNNNRTVANLRSYFTKFEGSLGKSGSVDYLFEHKCFYKIQAEDLDLEELELDLIDFGVDELFEDEPDEEAEYQGKVAMLYAPFKSYGKLQQALEDRSIEIIESGFERFPMNHISLNEEQTEEVEKLLEMIEEDDDVQDVYHNMDS